MDCLYNRIENKIIEIESKIDRSIYFPLYIN